MKIILAIILTGIIATESCKPKTPTPVKTPETPQVTIEEKKIDSFFPVTSFLRGQMALLDSLPVTPLHYYTNAGKTDSVWLKKNELRNFLQPFFIPEIAAKNLTEFFKETSFNDLSLNAVTLTYDPVKKLPDSLNLTHWDVYINPETGKVTKIYLVKNIQDQNKTYTQQLTWQVDKYAKIVTIIPDGKSDIVKEDKFVWGF